MGKDLKTGILDKSKANGLLLVGVPLFLAVLVVGLIAATTLGRSPVSEPKRISGGIVYPIYGTLMALPKGFANRFRSPGFVALTEGVCTSCGLRPLALDKLPDIGVPIVVFVSASQKVYMRQRLANANNVSYVFDPSCRYLHPSLYTSQTASYVSRDGRLIATMQLTGDLSEIGNLVREKRL